jgi:hypothetical protein
VADPGDLLPKLPDHGELAAGKVRGLAAVIPALVAAGWIDARKEGRAVIVRLTDAGRSERARRAAAAPTRKAKPAPAAARVAALEAAVAALTQRVVALETSARSPVEPMALRSTIVAVVGDLDARGRMGGLVPIPDVRAELRRRGVGASDAEVTHALEELERAWQIDLSVAQSPTAVSDRAAGIERAGRGLLYYVARR